MGYRFPKGVIDSASLSDVITDFNVGDPVYFAGYRLDGSDAGFGNGVEQRGVPALTQSDNTQITFLAVADVSQLQERAVSL
jgi:hypothetical protein